MHTGILVLFTFIFVLACEVFVKHYRVTCNLAAVLVFFYLLGVAVPSNLVC